MKLNLFSLSLISIIALSASAASIKDTLTSQNFLRQNYFPSGYEETSFIDEADGIEEEGLFLDTMQTQEVFTGCCITPCNTYGKVPWCYVKEGEDGNRRSGAEYRKGCEEMCLSPKVEAKLKELGLA